MLSAESYRTAKTVLFVDDESSILMMRRLVFEALGYSILTAISGEKALEALDLHPVDAVVLDYLMPGMDGEETAPSHFANSTAIFPSSYRQAVSMCPSAC